MSINTAIRNWKNQLDSVPMPKTVSFCGLPDPSALKKALDTNDRVVILVYRTFGISVRKSKWRKDRSSYMDQYWRRVFVKIGKVDKNRIQVFWLPSVNVLQASALLDSIVHGKFKTFSIGAKYEVTKSDLLEYEIEFQPLSDSHLSLKGNTITVGLDDWSGNK
jgi:hypothetical protein